MDEQTHSRYARQIRLPAIGEVGQQRLLDSHALVIGMGGLGSPVALYLGAAGVGTLTLCDYDQVDLSNLQRQVIHTMADIDTLKASSAKNKIKAINPDIDVRTIDYYADEEELSDLARKADVIVDCTDNFPSRFGLNRVSIATKTPLVSGAAIRWEGQITTYDPNQANSPCYHCLYPDEGIEGATCALEGVVAPVVGVIGTMQAQETINLLLGKPALIGTVCLFDARRMDWQSMTLPKNTSCPVCS